MNIKLDMTFFMFFGLTGAALVIYASARHFLCESVRNIRQIGAACAAVCALAAVAIVTVKINDPANMINILARPYTGLSCSILSQIFLFIFSILLFFYISEKKYPVQIILAAAVAIFSVYAMYWNYAMITRPALKGVVPAVLLYMAVLQLSAVLYSASAFDNDYGSDHQAYHASLSSGCLTVLLLLAFVMRLKGLDPQDRVLNLSDTAAGIYAPFLWGAVVCSFIIPASSLISKHLKQRARILLYLCVAAALVGLLLICALFNQMPVADAGYNDRVLF